MILLGLNLLPIIQDMPFSAKLGMDQFEFSAKLCLPQFEIGKVVLNIYKEKQKTRHIKKQTLLMTIINTSFIKLPQADSA